ncbi:MAG: hypothetical protein VX617_03995, partial [Pseudomonadota bacterium]|nr:hypothetical protein [Pseudomonadota bacterium]
KVIGSSLGRKGKRFFDPVGLFIGGDQFIPTNQLLQKLSTEKKRVEISVQTEDGKVIPSASKLVWPVACEVAE